MKEEQKDILVENEPENRVNGELKIKFLKSYLDNSFFKNCIYQIVDNPTVSTESAFSEIKFKRTTYYWDFCEIAFDLKVDEKSFTTYNQQLHEFEILCQTTLGKDYGNAFLNLLRDFVYFYPGKYGIPEINLSWDENNEIYGNCFWPKEYYPLTEIGRSSLAKARQVLFKTKPSCRNIFISAFEYYQDIKKANTKLKWESATSKASKMTIHFSADVMNNSVLRETVYGFINSTDSLEPKNSDTDVFEIIDQQRDCDSNALDLTVVIAGSIKDKLLNNTDYIFEKIFSKCVGKEKFSYFARALFILENLKYYSSKEIKPLLTYFFEEIPGQERRLTNASDYFFNGALGNEFFNRFYNEIDKEDIHISGNVYDTELFGSDFREIQNEFDKTLVMKGIDDLSHYMLPIDSEDHASDLSFSKVKQGKENENYLGKIKVKEEFALSLIRNFLDCRFTKTAEIKGEQGNVTIFPTTLSYDGDLLIKFACDQDLEYFLDEEAFKLVFMSIYSVKDYKAYYQLREKFRKDKYQKCKNTFESHNCDPLTFQCGEFDDDFHSQTSSMYLTENINEKSLEVKTLDDGKSAEISLELSLFDEPSKSIANDNEALDKDSKDSSKETWNKFGLTISEEYMTDSKISKLFLPFINEQSFESKYGKLEIDPISQDQFGNFEIKINSTGDWEHLCINNDGLDEDSFDNLLFSTIMNSQSFNDFKAFTEKYMEGRECKGNPIGMIFYYNGPDKKEVQKKEDESYRKRSPEAISRLIAAANNGISNLSESTEDISLFNVTDNELIEEKEVEFKNTEDTNSFNIDCEDYRTDEMKVSMGEAGYLLDDYANDLIFVERFLYEHRENWRIKNMPYEYEQTDNFFIHLIDKNYQDFVKDINFNYLLLAIRSAFSKMVRFDNRFTGGFCKSRLGDLEKFWIDLCSTKYLDVFLTDEVIEKRLSKKVTN